MDKLFIVLIVIFSSCTVGIDFDNVNYNNLFHDDNSKVWLVNKVIFKGAVISSTHYLDKDIIIFHENGVCDLVPFISISNGISTKGKFLIDSEKKTLKIAFPKETWIYNMTHITEDSISLSPTNESSSQFGLQLKPFMEL